MVFSVSRIDSAAQIAAQGQPDPQSLPQPPSVELEIVRGRAKQTRRQVVGKVFLIGSANDCDLVLGDKKFPEAYAYLYVTPEGVTIRHLGEGPVLIAEGQRVQTAALRDGAVIECGPFAFKIVVREAQPASVASAPQKVVKTAPTLASIPAAEDVLGLTIARTQVQQLLADVLATLAVPAAGLKVYRGPKTTLPKTVVEQPLRRAS